MNLTTRATRRIVTTSALAAALVGGPLVGGVVLPATAASAATPTPSAVRPAQPPSAAPVPLDPATAAPVPAETRSRPPISRAPGGVEPRGGVDTGLGGTAPAHHGMDLTVPVAAAGSVVGLSAVSAFGLRRRRAGARG